MAEWLRRGLQILARRFDSGSGLHSPMTAVDQGQRPVPRWGWAVLVLAALYDLICRCLGS
jgi:antibiotic biosynthesis monooxygenase (ABM) superfamily enzyme